jgi:hypothetical protein
MFALTWLLLGSYSPQAQRAEFGHQLKIRSHRVETFPNLADIRLAGLTHGLRHHQVAHQFRIHAHDTAARRIHGDTIRPGHQDPGVLPPPLDRAIALHTLHAVHDREQVRDRGVDGDDALIDPGSVQDILGPAVDRSGTKPNRFFMPSVTPAQ